MDSNYDKIKDKIKKLFALSKSPNANEAAAALEKAQGINLTAGGLEVVTEDVRGTSGKRPPVYEAYLVRKIAEAFGCMAAYGIVKKDPEQDTLFNNFVYGHTFAGLEHRATVAD